MGTTSKSGAATVEVPADLIEAIDDLVGAAERGAFVRDALRERIDGQRRLRALESLADRFASNPVPEWRTSESTERWVRDLRGEWDDPVPERGTG